VIVERVEHPGWLSNAYLVAEGPGGSGVLVDANGLEDGLEREADGQGIAITHVLCTHGHPDHVVGIEERARRRGVPLLAHPDTGVEADERLADGQVVRSGALDIQAVYTPGHCADHVAFLLDGSDCLTADCLFRGTVGGTTGGGPTGYRDQVRSIMERLDETIDQAIHETRSLTQDLSPQILYTLGFDAALDWLAENMQERYDLRCHIETQNIPTPLNDDWAVVAFQAVRELLINVVKHAGVKEAHLYVVQRGNAVALRVEDQGKGFLPDELELPRSHGGGFGLFSIRERLSLLGGRLEIHSQPGGGTIAQIVIPMAFTDSAGPLHELDPSRTHA
jgi:two-component sensor histidine kinase